MTNKTVIKLEYPIEFEGETIKLISFRRTKYRDVKKIRDLKDGENILDTLMVDLSQEKSELFDEVDSVDIKKIEKLISGFLEGEEKKN